MLLGKKMQRSQPMSWLKENYPGCQRHEAMAAVLSQEACGPVTRLRKTQISSTPMRP